MFQAMFALKVTREGFFPKRWPCEPSTNQVERGLWEGEMAESRYETQ
jgi:hypothetical protein